MLLQFGFYFQYVGRTWLGFILLFELISFYTRRIIFSFFFCSPWFLVLFIKEKNNRTMWRTSNKYSCPIFYFLPIFIFITLIRPSVFYFFFFAPDDIGTGCPKKEKKMTSTNPDFWKVTWLSFFIGVLKSSGSLVLCFFRKIFC